MATTNGEDPVKKTIIVVLTVVFVALYVTAIVGTSKWDSDTMAIQLLQPIVYVIIGYFFGRMPSEPTEKALRKDAQEKGKQADDAKAEASQVSTKLKSVRAILSGAAGGDAPQAKGFAQTLSGTRATSEDALKITVSHALNVIDQ